MSDDRCPADQPHTSMDVDGIHVEGHWKRSPENDAAIAEVVKAAANKVNPPAPSDEVEEARNALGLLLTYARCSHIDAANGKNTCDDLYEKVDAVLTTLRKQAERDAAVREAVRQAVARLDWPTSDTEPPFRNLPPAELLREIGDLLRAALAAFKEAER